MTKSIPLTQGKFALVDDGDYEYLSQWKWHFNSGYAARADKYLGNIFMHNAIMRPMSGLEVDHKNGDTLNDQRENLRYCTRSQNGANRGKQKNNTSGYKGVCWDGNRRKWRCQIRIRHFNKHIGYFPVIEDAARAYDKMAMELFGEFAQTNF